MIKGLIFDIGDVIYDVELKYKHFSPWFLRIGVEQLFLAAASFLIRHGFYKKNYSEMDMKRMRRKLKPRQGVPETLKKLKQKKLKIVFLTDTVVSPLKMSKRAEALGVLDFIDKIVCSTEIGTTKPNAKAYEMAIKSVGLKKEEVLFVGHAKDELEGARKAGIRTIGYNLDWGAKADFYAEHFSDVLKIIGELNAKRSNRRS